MRRQGSYDPISELSEEDKRLSKLAGDMSKISEASERLLCDAAVLKLKLLIAGQKFVASLNAPEYSIYNAARELDKEQKLAASETHNVGS